MSEAKQIIRKLLPHLRTLSLDASRDELYEVKALISEAEAFLANDENEPEQIAEIVYVEEFKSSLLVANDGVRFDDFPVGTKFYAEPPAREPLTIMQITKLAEENTSPYKLARAIEAHLIKG